MSERFSTQSPERIKPAFTPEQRNLQPTAEIPKQSPEMREKTIVESAEKARQEAEHAPAPLAEKEATPVVQDSGVGRKQAYRATRQLIARDQSAPERAFSSFVHNKTVEAVSDTAAKTIARPKPLLWAGVGACLSLGFFYLIADHYGYRMSGFEGIAGLIVGYGVGIIVDLFSRRARR